MPLELLWEQDEHPAYGDDLCAYPHTRVYVCNEKKYAISTWLRFIPSPWRGNRWYMWAAFYVWDGGWCEVALVRTSFDIGEITTVPSQPPEFPDHRREALEQMMLERATMFIDG